MTVDGIWKVEIFGPYGWEPMATAFLENGIYKAGARNHYSVGSYQVSGDKIKISSKYITHGKARTMFGKKLKEMDMEFEGDVKKDQIQGYVREKGNNPQVTFRATHLKGPS